MTATAFQDTAPLDDGPAGAALQARSLVRRYDVSAPALDRWLQRGARRQWLQAVDGVDLSLAPGRTLGLVGESGCGKSTLARLLVGLERPDGGSVEVDGQPLHLGRRPNPALRGRLQMVFQDPMASLNPRWRVRELVGEPLLELQPALKADEREARVVALLARVGLSADDLKRWPHEFSGGQRQRIAIARALAASPRLLVCDEPTSALDVSVQAQVLALLRDLQQAQRLTLVFISHNLAVVRQVSDEVAVMLQGRVVETGTAEAVFAQPQHDYTRALIAAVPDPHRLSR